MSGKADLKARVGLCEAKGGEAFRIWFFSLGLAQALKEHKKRSWDSDEW